MARYVDVDKYLSDDFCDSHDNCTKWEDCFLCWSRKAIEDVAPVDNAEWVEKKSMIYCSNCASGWDTGYINDFNYCPNCGARIIRGE